MSQYPTGRGRMAFALLAVLLLATRPVPGEEPFLSSVDPAIQNGQYRKALALLDAFPPSLATLPAATYRRALCLYRVGEFGSAERCAQGLLNADSCSAPYRNLAGAICLRLGRFTEASLHFYASLRTNPNDAHVWMNLSYAMRQTMYRSPSSSLLVHLDRDFPDVFGKQFVKAEYHFTSYKPTGYRKLVREAGRTDLPEPYLRRLALFARQMGDLELDVALVRQLIRIDPRHCTTTAPLTRLLSVLARRTRMDDETKYAKDGSTLTAPTDETVSPSIGRIARSRDGFLLPFQSGEARYCAQGQNGPYSHNGRRRYACDFYMKPGSPVVAARSGIVKTVRELPPPGPADDYGAFVALRHSDGTRSRYFHLAENSVKVNVGQHVRRGQQIAASGWTTLSRYPILHFDVVKPAFFRLKEPSPYRRWKSIPFSFEDLRDLPEEQGIPMSERWYVSANRM